MLKSVVTLSLPLAVLLLACNSPEADNEPAPEAAVTETPSSSEGPSPSASPSMADPTSQSAPIQMQPQVNAQPAVTAAGAVFHYICPNKCAGSGSEGQGKCPVCKTDLVHNDAFHNQTSQQPQINTQPQNNQVQLNTQAQTPPPPPQDAPQNAKGVWHYTCPKGCAGGGGQAVACVICGTQMEHNQKYHE